MKYFILSLLFILFSQNLLAKSLKNKSPKADFNRIKQLKIKNLSELQQLTPYESVAVIQKRYLPKTLRGEFGLSVSSIINHTFFYLGGVSAHTGFFLREDHGFGVEAFAMLDPKYKIITNQLIAPPNQILPFTNSFSKLYGGVYYKWSPIFGKFAVLDKRIIYFDMYMTLGVGVSRIIKGLKEETQKLLEEGQVIPELVRDFSPTLSSGLGQVFALSKDWSAYWELKWLFTLVQLKEESDLYVPVDINLSIGVNYYFPGASYR